MNSDHIMENSIVPNYIRKRSLAFKMVNFLFLIFIVRITFLTTQKDAPGLDAYIMLQLVSVTAMFLIALIQNQVSVKLVPRSMPIFLALSLYGLAMLSYTWSVMPELSLVLAIQNVMFIYIIFYLMGYPDDFYATEKYLIILLVVPLLASLLRKPVTYGIIPTLSYYLQYHELNAGGISAVLIVYCLSERLSWPKNLNVQRAKMLTWMTIFGFFCLMISTSSGANVSMLVGFITLMLIRRKWFYLFALLACVLAITIFPGIIDDVTSYIFPNKSRDTIMMATGRTVLWSDIWQMFQEKPILGWGFATVERLCNIYASDSHNSFLGILGGLGILGAFIFVLFIISLIFKMFKLRYLHGYTGLFCATVCMVSNSNTFGFLSGKIYGLTIAFFALMASGYWYQLKLADENANVEE